VRAQSAATTIAVPGVRRMAPARGRVAVVVPAVLGAGRDGERAEGNGGAEGEKGLVYLGSLQVGKSPAGRASGLDWR